MANSPEFASKPPGQIVPILADRGIYLASESTFYRVLKATGQMGLPRVETGPQANAGGTYSQCDRAVPGLDLGYSPAAAFGRIAAGGTPSWLPAAVAGMFYKLYMVIDVYSPKIVAWEVHTIETADLASELIRKACFRENITAPGLVQHVR